MKAKFMMMMAAAATVLAACSNDNETDNWAGEIRLSSGVSVQTRAYTPTAPDTQIAADELIGIYVSGVDGEPITTYGYSNVSAKADGSGNFGTYSATMYYPQSGKDVKIKAYHPYNDGADDTYDFTVEADQSVDANYYKSDLLYSGETTIARSKTAHSLTFTHKLAKIFCTLTAGDGVSTVGGATIEVLSAEKAANFNRKTGDVNTAATSTKGDVKLGTYGAIIAPQEIANSTQLLKITLSADAGSGVFYYTTKAKTTFDSGNIYQYEITVTATGLTVTSTITPWQGIEGDPTTGTAEMQ
ncbi:fimbrillin family protein [Bacteroides helcogenes]|uniref:Fimbrillin family protein n=1 Tax=Bacteroides helcogenes (strain ATCC 35417 / DSM 20613 / JCM 6297 / CCUG 15421 / P 36-108) TaxID=693979 RepID=E6SP23_BACT6|nr:fimbrillin family protein [Bacteroides helcogenes]ADV43793.1 hypothetical protein Bache_1812 [Bacteroides helcogenes P 36-108]MDY5237423.1 fimbrillin family protein [Bacteroides helcogenes]